MSLHPADSGIVSGSLDFSHLRENDAPEEKSDNGYRPSATDDYEEVCELINMFNGVCREDEHGNFDFNVCQITGDEQKNNTHILPHANRHTTAIEAYAIAHGWLSPDARIRNREKMRITNMLKCSAKIASNLEPNVFVTTLAATIPYLRRVILAVEAKMLAFEAEEESVRSFFQYNMMEILQDLEPSLPGRPDVKLCEYEVYAFGRNVLRYYVQRIGENGQLQEQILRARTPLEYPTVFDPPLPSTMLGCNIFFTVLMTWKCLMKQVELGRELSPRALEWMSFATYLLLVLESELASDFRRFAADRPTDLGPMPEMNRFRTHRAAFRQGSKTRDRMGADQPFPMDTIRDRLSKANLNSRREIPPRAIHRDTVDISNNQGRQQSDANEPFEIESAVLSKDEKQPRTPEKAQKGKDSSFPLSDLSDCKNTQFGGEEEARKEGEEGLVAELLHHGRVEDFYDLNASQVKLLMKGAIKELEESSKIAFEEAKEYVTIDLGNGQFERVRTITSKGLYKLRTYVNLDLEKRQNDLTILLEDAEMRLEQLEEEELYEHRRRERILQEARYPSHDSHDSPGQGNNMSMLIM